jgi:hypothetical protein
MTLRSKAAIVGIGATEFSKDSGRTELTLAAECVLAALADAGLTPADVDGLVTFTQDANSEIAVAREVGVPELRFFSRVDYGGGAACATAGPRAPRCCMPRWRSRPASRTSSSATAHSTSGPAGASASPPRLPPSAWTAAGTTRLG